MKIVTTSPGLPYRESLKRKNEMMAKIVSPPSTPEYRAQRIEEPGPSGRQATSGRKRGKRDRACCYRHVAKLTVKLAASERRRIFLVHTCCRPWRPPLRPFLVAIARAARCKYITIGFVSNNNNNNKNYCQYKATYNITYNYCWNY